MDYTFIKSKLPPNPGCKHFPPVSLCVCVWIVCIYGVHVEARGQPQEHHYPLPLRQGSHWLRAHQVSQASH